MIRILREFRKNKGFHLIEGCRASCERKLREGFEQRERGFVANVSAEHIDPLMRAYIAAQTEELFLFIETPCSQQDEEPDENGIVTQFHVNVYYWDGITKAEANAVLDQYGDWLIHDGFACFGFGIAGFSSEIMKDRYNVISLFSTDPARDRPLLAQRLPESKALKTAWNYFDRQHPGTCFPYRKNGQTVYDVVNALLQQGLYFTQRKAAH